MTERERVAVRLFGEPAVSRGATTTVLARMPGTLLGALVLAGPDGAHTDVLADALWPGPMPKTHETALRVHMLRLREALGDDGSDIVRRRPHGGYALDPELVDVDVDRFSRLVDDCTCADRDSDAAEVFERATEALALWVDEPYRGLENVSHAVAARSVMHDKKVQVCELLAAAGTRLGRSGDVVATLAPILASTPSEERIGLPYVRALVHEGRAGDAVRAADALQHALRVDLGVTSQAVAELVAQVQKPAVLTAAAGTTAPLPIGRPADGPFLGRDDELVELLDRVTAPDRAATVTVVHGPAGIGKTRLVEELARRAQGVGVAAALGRADRNGSPYGAIASLLRADVHRAGSIDGGPLDALAPSAAGGDAPWHEALMSNQGARSRLHHEVAAWLLSAEPVLVVVDDAQWLDPDSATLLREVVEAGARQGCHLVLLRRPVASASIAAERLVSDLADVAPLFDVVLGPLNKESTSRLADLLGLPTADPVDLFERTGGNPLLVHEVARLETRHVDPAEVLIDLVTRRFLADGVVRRLLEVGAVLGDRFRVADLVEVMDGPGPETHEALADCEREGILVVDNEGWAEFAHGLVPEIIQAASSRTDQQRLHLQAFNALSPTGSDRLAVHARGAGPLIDAPDAIRAIAAAAAAADRRLAFEQATDLYTQALDLQAESRALPPAEAVRLHVELASSVAHTDEARCDEIRRRALPMAAEAASPAAVVDLAEANVGRGLQQTDELVDLLEAARRWHPDPVTSVRLRARLAIERAESDRTPDAFRLAAEALDDAVVTGEPRAIASAQRAVVSTGVHRLDPARYRGAIDELISTSRAVPDLDLEMIGLTHLVVDRLRRRETDGAINTLRGFRILAEDRRWPRYQAFAAGIGAVLALTRGDIADFERRAERTTALARDCGFDDAEVMVAGQLVCRAWHEGTLGDLTDLLRGLAADADLDGQAIISAALACALAERGAPGDLDEAHEVAMAIDHPTLPRAMLYSACLALLSSYCLSAGDVDLARTLIPPMSALAGSDIVAGAGLGHFGPAEGFVARLHLATGSVERAGIAFDQAMRSARGHQQVLALRRLELDRDTRPPARKVVR